MAAGAGVAAPTGRGALVGGALFSGAGYVATTGTGTLVAGGIAAAIGNEHPRGTGALIAGALFTNGQTFYQATVAPGAVDIAGSLYTNTQTFYGGPVNVIKIDNILFRGQRKRPRKSIMTTLY